LSEREPREQSTLERKLLEVDEMITRLRTQGHATSTDSTTTVGLTLTDASAVESGPAVEQGPADHVGTATTWTEPVSATDTRLVNTAKGAEDLGAARHVAWVSLNVLATIALSLALQLIFLSGLQHQAAQRREFDNLRKQLAEGTAPVSQTNLSNRLWPLGTPVAIIKISSINVREVIGEGTTPAVLMSGPGHRRDSPLPGQAGASIIMGRAAAYGGPFKRLGHLRRGATITVITGQGVSTFKVIDRRHPHDPAPPRLGSGRGRLTLITARGIPFIPAGTLRIDADLTSETEATPPTVIPYNRLPHREQALGTDTSTLWALVLWLEGLVVAAVGSVWAWIRWGRHQAWIIFVPLIALIGIYVAEQVARLLPNLL
jgi:LPXTG-site transpeptidase (sortase) family protein